MTKRGPRRLSDLRQRAALHSVLVSEGQANAEARASGARCPCGCCHAVDHGPCPGFNSGMNGRCVYCDHGEACHAYRPKPEAFNTPL